MMKCVVVLILLIALFAYSESCSCQLSHPQNLFCKADFVMQIRLQSRKAQQSPEVVLDHVRYYSVRINRIFKLVDNEFGINENTTVTKMVTSAYTSVCGVVLEENTKYVVSGKFNAAGQMQLGLCSSMLIPWPHITKRMKKNLQFRYKPNCQCKVVDSSNDATPNSCMWKFHRADADCYSRHSTCIEDINSTTGGCKWHRNRHLKTCRAEAANPMREP